MDKCQMIKNTFLYKILCVSDYDVVICRHLFNIADMELLV